MTFDLDIWHAGRLRLDLI